MSLHMRNMQMINDNNWLNVGEGLSFDACSHFCDLADLLLPQRVMACVTTRKRDELNKAYI